MGDECNCANEDGDEQLFGHHKDCPLYEVPLGRVRKHLQEHWLTGIHCDHEAKTDKATCYCTVWASTPMPSIGSAVEAWIDHFISTIVPTKRDR